jgi:hypothetical protein
VNNKEIYERLLQCAWSDRKDWRKCDKFTEFEQEVEYNAVLEGIKRAALYLLPTDDYFRWCREVNDGSDNNI